MSEQKTNNQQEQEVDLAELFRIIGRGISNFFEFLGRLFYNLFAFIILILLFIKKNFIVLLLAAILGFITQLIINNYQEDVFEASAIVETNYQIEFQLRTRIDELNQLLKNNDTKKLASLLNISQKQANEYLNFEIEPFFSNNKLRFDYYEHVHKKDTAVQNLFTYETYESNMRFEDYDYYEIVAYSKNPEAFDVLNDKLWDFNNLDYIQERRKRERDILLNKKRLLEVAFNSIDSNRQTMREVLRKEAERPVGASSTQIDLGTRQPYKEDPEIYEYEKALAEDIVETIGYLNKTDNIVNVVKRFPVIGSKYNKFSNHFFILVFVALATFIILLIRLSRYLGKTENNNLWKFKKL